MNELDSLNSFLDGHYSKERAEEIKSMATIAGYWWLNKTHVEKFLNNYEEIDYDDLMSKIANSIKKEITNTLIKNNGKMIIKSFIDSTSDELTIATSNIGLKCSFENGIMMIIDNVSIEVNDNGKQDVIYVKKSFEASKYQQK